MAAADEYDYWRTVAITPAPAGWVVKFKEERRLFPIACWLTQEGQDRGDDVERFRRIVPGIFQPEGNEEVVTPDWFEDSGPATVHFIGEEHAARFGAKEVAR